MFKYVRLLLLFGPDSAHQSGASAVSDHNNVNIWVVVSSCYPAVSSELLAGQTQLPLPHKRWHINPPLRPCHSTHCKPSPRPQPWRSPSASSPHSWTYAPFFALESLTLVCMSSLLFSKLPWCQSLAMKQHNCASWCLPSGFGKYMKVLQPFIQLS